ncbi:hypothetical protein [Cerasicoccus frondis]|uniref:hypothetical protein n=1 Tax=Cerasicoccus frondis TaxID=490090 RepID=UPI002852C97B|nr:hypothetical protein [Cerasicoccus frondis]
MQYLLLIHDNTTTETKPEEWDAFFEAARKSGLFQGGSALGERWMLGEQSATSTNQITGFMQFNAGNRQQVIDLLNQHPVLLHGGSAELCEMPKS